MCVVSVNVPHIINGIKLPTKLDYPAEVGSSKALQRKILKNRSKAQRHWRKMSRHLQAGGSL